MKKIKKGGYFTIKRNWIIPIIIGVLIVGITGYWGYGQYQEKQQLETYLGNRYQQAFYEMVQNVEQIQVLLGKALVSNSPRQNILHLTDVWKHATTAQAELTQLPITQAALYRTAKFLSQAGDYAHVMARKNSDGQVMGGKNRDQLNNLRQQAAKLSTSLHQLEGQIFKGKVSWPEVVRGTKNQMANTKPNTIADGFDDIKEEFSQIPTLVYDGPFSDHITEGKPKGLTGENITNQKAKNKATKVVDFSNKNGLNVSDSKSVKGRVPAYNFNVKKGKNNSYSVDISKKGGHLVNMISTRSVGNSKIKVSEAADKAKEYLARIGYPNMKPTYSERDQNIAYISFAYKPKDITYYPDIIDVQVALDNGQVLAVEALSYLMSHHKREEQKPKLSKSQIKDRISNDLDKIENIKLAVIPMPDLNEVLTYEVRGKRGDEIYLIYVNANNGDEEQILKVVNNKQGTFTL